MLVGPAFCWKIFVSTGTTLTTMWAASRFALVVSPQHELSTLLAGLRESIDAVIAAKSIDARLAIA